MRQALKQRRRPRGGRALHRRRLHQLHDAAGPGRWHAAVPAAGPGERSLRLAEALEASRGQDRDAADQRTGPPPQRAVAGPLRRHHRPGVVLPEGAGDVRARAARLRCGRSLAGGGRLVRLAARRRIGGAAPALHLPGRLQGDVERRQRLSVAGVLRRAGPAAGKDALRQASRTVPLARRSGRRADGGHGPAAGPASPAFR